MPAVNTPTLTLTDLANGSGVTATVAGSTTGSTNTIYAAQWAGGFVPQAHTSQGSRTGDGNVSLTLSTGYWWVYCRSTLAGSDGAVSLIKGVRVTDGDDSLFYQCLTAIQAKIQALSLPSPWTDPDNVFVRKFPWNRTAIAESATAGIWITPLSDQFRFVNNQADDWGLGIQITAGQASNFDLSTGITADLMLRQQIIGALLPTAGEQPLAGVSEVINIVIEPGPVLDAGAFQQNYDVGAFVARCIARRTRGLA
jgi:hypothetical protein